MRVRLQKFLAHAGIASRRKCEDLIRANRVIVNGQIAKIGMQINPDLDKVVVDGKVVKKVEHKLHIILNKPRGYITTAKDQFGRKSVLDLIKGVNERIYPVGRLDHDSTGLLLLTNDGSLAHRVMHPRYGISKTYLVQVKGRISQKAVIQLREGIELDDGPTMPAHVIVLSRDSHSRLQLTISEGKNRQIRRMCSAVGHEVTELQRISIGPLQIGKLKLGEYRELTNNEVQQLKQAVRK